jgi:hypothetical protein
MGDSALIHAHNMPKPPEASSRQMFLKAQSMSLPNNLLLCASRRLRPPVNAVCLSPAVQGAAGAVAAAG